MELSKKSQTPHMFNKIASRYDFINRVLSMGMDILWRKQMVAMLPKERGLTALDVAAGTGDQTVALLQSPDVGSVVALDPSTEMLKVAQEKVREKKIHKSVEFELASVEEMPFLDAAFNVITMSFGIRNVPDVQKALKEMYRVLSPGGQVYILEFSLAQNFVIRFFQKIYLRTFVPIVGGYLSGSKSAYSYLDKSIEAFPYGDNFVKELHAAGFSAATYFPLTFGVVTIYVARR